MKHLFTVLFGALLLQGGMRASAQTMPAAPPAALRNEELKSWLRQNWYDGKRTVLSYDEARGRMYNFVDVFNDKVTCVYSGHQETVKIDSSKTDPGVVSSTKINCEHTVPQSWFNEVVRMRSDIHHLFPSFPQWNSDRGSDPFAEIPDSKTTKWMRDTQSQPTIPTSNIDEYSEDTNSQFEPREDHKGNLARAVFYFYTMHANESFDAGKNVITAAADLQTLYKWHLQDPVDAHEIERNRRVAKVQGNFNPYIAHPELVARAWGFDTTPAGPVISFAALTGSLTEGQTGSKTYTANVTISPAPTSTVTVDVTLGNGTATADTDFTFSAQTLTFSPTVTTQTVTLTVLGDDVAEPSETVVLQLGTPSGGVAVGTGKHTLTIVTDDQPANTGGGACKSLYFSQYVESSGGNTKVLEIYNPTNSAITLDGHRVALYANGLTTVKESLNLTGTLAAHDVYVVANSGSDAAVLALADNKTSTVTYFNGNDAVALFSGTDTLDVIGRIGQDPGAAGWTVTGGTTTDNTLIRLPTIGEGSKRWNAAAAATWQAQGANSFTDLGTHTSTACSVTAIRASKQVAEGLQLFPNPASRQVLLRVPALAASQLAQVQLFNTVGQRVVSSQQRVGGTATAELAVEQLPAGLYFVRVDAGAAQYYGQLTIQK